MTRYLAALLAGVALSVAFSGPLHAEGKVIGVSWVQKNQREAEETAIRTAVEAAGNSYVAADAGSSAEKQIADINGLIGQGVNALIIVAQDGSAVAPAAEKAITAGIPVLGYGRPVELAGTFHVGFDETEIGRTQARAALRVKPQGNYAFVKGPFGDAQSDTLYAGQMQTLEAQLGSGSVRNVAEMATDGSLPAGAERNMIQILTANDNQIDAVLAANDAIAGGVVAALDTQGMAGAVAVVGQGGDKPALNRIALGMQTATVWKDVRELGYAAGDIASELAEGKKPAEISGAVNYTTPGGNPVRSVFPPPVAIVSDNLDLVIDAGWASKEEVCAGVAAGAVAACD